MFSYKIQTFHEDADVFGVIYHPNFLKYFDRARSNLLGVSGSISVLKNQNLGYTVYKANQTFSFPVFLGDEIEIRTRFKIENSFRITCYHEVWKDGLGRPAVAAEIYTACVDLENHVLRKFPKEIMKRLKDLERAIYTDQ